MSYNTTLRYVVTNNLLAKSHTFPNKTGIVNIGAKEIFINGVDFALNNGNYRVRNVGTGGSFRFTFSIPYDVVSINEIVLVYITASAGAAGGGKNIDLSSSYGAIGESSTIHTGTDTTTTYTIPPLGSIGHIDATNVFSSALASDFCGLLVTHNAIGGSLDYLGIYINYETD